MKIIISALAIACSFHLLGCQATSAVLGRETRDKYIEVVSPDPATDVAAELEASGKIYFCKEFYYGSGSSKNRTACFVKAPEENLYKRLGIKLKDVPEALLKDTGKNVLVVGKVTLVVVLSAYFPWLGGYPSTPQ